MLNLKDKCTKKYHFILFYIYIYKYISKIKDNLKKKQFFSNIFMQMYFILIFDTPSINIFT